MKDSAASHRSPQQFLFNLALIDRKMLHLLWKQLSNSPLCSKGTHSDTSLTSASTQHHFPTAELHPVPPLMERNWTTWATLSRAGSRPPTLCTERPPGHSFAAGIHSSIGKGTSFLLIPHCFITNYVSSAFLLSCSTGDLSLGQPAGDPCCAQPGI